MSRRDIILSHPVRTAIGAYNGTLKSVQRPRLVEFAKLYKANRI